MGLAQTFVGLSAMAIFVKNLLRMLALSLATSAPAAAAADDVGNCSYSSAIFIARVLEPYRGAKMFEDDHRISVDDVNDEYNDDGDDDMMMIMLNNKYDNCAS